MGVARLLAKGWVVFCLFAGAHAVNLALGRGEQPWEALQAIAVCVLLFGAMGLLFIAGFGASSGAGARPFLLRLKPRHFVPGFDGAVLLVFLVLSFAVQVFLRVPAFGGSSVEALQRAMYFVVPGHISLVTRLMACALGPRIFPLALASAFTWLLAIIFVASAVSRIRLTAGLLRLEYTMRPSAFGPTLLAALYGVVAIVCFQLLYVGSAYAWLGCGVYSGLTGLMLIGLAPLLLAYLIVAALATLRASGPES
ncbi:MAG TPA: hypothetical protein VII56_17355 [Rhizomicrobium sp.]